MKFEDLWVAITVNYKIDFIKQNNINREVTVAIIKIENMTTEHHLHCSLLAGVKHYL